MPLCGNGSDEFEEHCQRCHSTNIEIIYDSLHAYLITGFMWCFCIGFPLARVLRRRICRNCEMEMLSNQLGENRTEMGLKPYHLYEAPLTTNQQLAVLKDLERDIINDNLKLPL
uniref:LITAF domain-containing protein n=1 Tax=Rhabditophanes sp. KR3021 TaxID=114890 RepID=A0AC35TZW5_9BILA